MTVTATDRDIEVSRPTSYASFEITSLTPHLGAEVHGLDLSGPLDESALRDGRQAFADWGVLVFRE